ncbi:hypothetical protein A5724_23445 [Mycobacterium sp. ACS1612]|uniref:DUF202 domain-containing protein n=1 Tax=Mycobacterium sp. ACS1612 TaxID=1834117 RepID=UPI000801D849|nr:DUF202 domain-containing protein [Mycobacterium sp. ACS1612]OBF30957.1 hypothetical protein A5724_23445 [Mycobacterium sp. ACS1612]
MTTNSETQPQRTSLAWSRTSLAVLANGLLLSLKETRSGMHIAAAAAAALLAVATYLIGVRRQRILASRPLPDRISPQREVYLTGAAVLALILISGAALAV